MNNDGRQRKGYRPAGGVLSFARLSSKIGAFRLEGQPKPHYTMKIEHTDDTTKVRFSEHGVPFELTTAVCDNLDCDCREISLYLRELEEEDPLEFRLTVNVDSWEERGVLDREAQISRWASEFLDELSEEDKRRLYLLYDEKFATKRLQDCALNREDVLNGALISYTDIVSEDSSFYNGGTTCISRFEHNGTEYAMDALYCANPECPCNEAHLLFIRLIPARPGQIAATSEERLRAVLKFDGNWRVEQRWNTPLVEAQRLLAAWLEGHPGIIERFEEEYHAIKEIGLRSLQLSPPSSGSDKHRAVQRKRIGRNAPCSCGSGKKYKKCCGA